MCAPAVRCTAGEWRAWLLHTVFAEALVVVVAQLMSANMEEAWSIVHGWLDTMPIRDVYLWLQSRCSPRILCDKTPSYADHPAILLRCIHGWQDPFFIHLHRHPVAVIPSFIELGAEISVSWNCTLCLTHVGLYHTQSLIGVMPFVTAAGGSRLPVRGGNTLRYLSQCGGSMGQCK